MILLCFLLPLALLLPGPIDAITQSSKIDRPDAFKSDPKDAFSTTDTNLIRIVDPLPAATLTQTLFEHSITPKQHFFYYHQNAVEGNSHFGMHTHQQLAQRELNVLLQDYLPMNEADLAAAMFMFALKDCQLKADKQVPQGLNACQYHGARFLQDIVHRTGPIHNALTFGMILPETRGKKKLVPVMMEVPPQWNEQVAKIVSNLGTEEASRSLEAVDAAAGVVWRSMRQSLANRPN